MSGEDDGGYSALAHSFQRKIDDAFDSGVLSSSRASTSSSSHSSKRRKLDQDHSPRSPSTLSVGQPNTSSNQPPPGGFILDDPSPGGFVRDDSPPPGGFLPESSRHSDPGQDDVPTHLSTSIDMY